MSNIAKGEDSLKNQPLTGPVAGPSTPTASTTTVKASKLIDWRDMNNLD
ncbi:MAG: hypothetical protein P8M08_03645 [Akkermansiaceae bacterium]|nr:hypothetical protein [Akkermansiaceae bacterium]